MSIEGVLEIIKEFFAAITKIFEALGIFGSADADQNKDQTTGA